MSGALGVGDAWNLSHVGNGTGWLVYVRHFRSAPCCGALAVCLDGHVRHAKELLETMNDMMVPPVDKRHNITLDDAAGHEGRLVVTVWLNGLTQVPVNLDEDDLKMKPAKLAKEILRAALEALKR